MHVQRAGGGGYVVIILRQHTLNMLPLQAFDRLGFRVQAHIGVAAIAIQRGNDFINFSGFCQVMRGTELDGFDRGRCWRSQ